MRNTKIETKWYISEIQIVRVKRKKILEIQQETNKIFS